MKKLGMIFIASLLFVNVLSEEQEEIMKKVKQIEAGTTPSGVKSANTTSLSVNVNGKKITIKATIYSTGTEKKGSIQNVQVMYEGEKEIDRSINSIIWDGDKVTKKSIQSSPQSGNNNISFNSNSGILSSSSGETVISSSD